MCVCHTSPSQGEVFSHIIDEREHLITVVGCRNSRTLWCANVSHEFIAAPSWASEASPTLGCSIEISLDVDMYVYDCLWENNTKN